MVVLVVVVVPIAIGIVVLVVPIAIGMVVPIVIGMVDRKQIIEWNLKPKF